VFQLIQESHTTHPKLCAKTLDALLKILEGQPPQSLKKEPLAVIGLLFKKIQLYYLITLKLMNSSQPFVLTFYFTDSLFEALLNLSKYVDTDAPSSSKSSTSQITNDLTSSATSCLISLAIARGETKSMLEAIASLLMCTESLSTQTIKVITISEVIILKY